MDVVASLLKDLALNFIRLIFSEGYCIKLRFMSFQFFPQYDAMDCGPACLQMILNYHGSSIPLQKIRSHAFLNKTGVSLLSLSNAAKDFGFESMAAQLTIAQLRQEFNNPCIIHWKGNHFVVLLSINNKSIQIADPAHGILDLPLVALDQFWIQDGKEGVVLFINGNAGKKNQNDTAFGKFSYQPFKELLGYLKPFQGLLNQLWLGLFIACVFDLLLPFTTQSMIDYGVNFKQISFVNLLLIAQLGIFFSRTFIDWVRSKILLYVGAEVNLSIVSDFLNKLMRLPISFFDGKHVGDISQRVNDQKKLEIFLTSNTLTTFFALFNLVVYAAVLIYFSVSIFFVFFLGAAASIIWILYFQNERKKLDYLSFQKLSQTQSQLFELVTAMPDIKLSGASARKTSQWRNSQIELYKLKTKLLNVNRMQQFGSSFFNQFKNIVITYIAAKEVINGSNGMTLGALIAISFIVGQMNAPIEKLLDFIRSWQDAKLSMLRLNEVHEMKDEENQESSNSFTFKDAIKFENVSFSYSGDLRFAALKDINLSIPYGKTTAIVGASGSGKSTLVKLLLKFYEPFNGVIKIDSGYLSSINASTWRNSLGVVLQDGVLFSDTIASNIVATSENFEEDKMNQVLRQTNLLSYISNLPSGIQTVVGQNGEGLSAGQKQRILLARAIYKDPGLLILDEATSALDAVNEKEIVNHLINFTANKTVIVIAHRLSTVKNADQIVVMENGRIKEIGSHDELIGQKGAYYNLVKNQLDLNV